MATNNEIAAFEDFQFNVGDLVRLIAERTATDEVINKALASSRGEMIPVSVCIGMVTYRSLIQDESGVSRVYNVRGPAGTAHYKEFELEPVTTTNRVG